MNKNILLVDNDREILDICQKSFEKDELNVENVKTLESALVKLNEKKPDLIITEVMLEHSDSGFTLCYQAKKKYPDIPIIIISDVANKMGIHFDLDDRDSKEWIKADVFLEKPVTCSQLIQHIEKLLP